ncbi:hypothetical protein C8Q78DRAFT_1194574 [Trametes maxima]|nr:hypothetical protein C8Q78DRAFT_1194574 [Trametes maxima]
MSYTTFAPSYTLSGPASPGALSLFSASQSPRESYHMYEDARQVLRPSNGRITVKKTKPSGLKKIFGL